MIVQSLDKIENKLKGFLCFIEKYGIYHDYKKLAEPHEADLEGAYSLV